MRTPRASPRRAELDALRDWFDYNSFVRKKYLRLIVRLPRGVVTKDRGASYPSILDVFTHVLDVYKSWFHVVEHGEDLSEIKGLSLAGVRKLETEVDEYVKEYISKLTPGDFESSTYRYTYGKGSKKRTVTRKLADLLWHLVEEELQHRGELNALLWQEGIEPPITTWGEWKRTAAPRK
jgi:uncharacterized damage-inducible protein DinB